MKSMDKMKLRENVGQIVNFHPLVTATPTTTTTARTTPNIKSITRGETFTLQPTVFEARRLVPPETTVTHSSFPSSMRPLFSVLLYLQTIILSPTLGVLYKLRRAVCFTKQLRPSIEATPCPLASSHCETMAISVGIVFFANSMCYKVLKKVINQ